MGVEITDTCQDDVFRASVLWLLPPPVDLISLTSLHHHVLLTNSFFLSSTPSLGLFYVFLHHSIIPLFLLFITYYTCGNMIINIVFWLFFSVSSLLSLSNLSSLHFGHLSILCISLRPHFPKRLHPGESCSHGRNVS